MTDSVAIKRQHAWGRLYNAANAVAARIGADGAISTRSPEISILMDALAEIDGGQWCPGIMPYPTALPEHAEPPPEPVEPVAWLRFQEHADRPTTVHLCDSDHPRAFQVYAAQPAEPVEPVACKGIPRKGCNYLAYADTVCSKCGEVHHHHQMLAHFYAAPAALTDEQIDDICWSLNCSNLPLVEYDRLIARAIERAHGVGDKP